MGITQRLHVALLWPQHWCLHVTAAISSRQGRIELLLGQVCTCAHAAGSCLVDAHRVRFAGAHLHAAWRMFSSGWRSASPPASFWFITAGVLVVAHYSLPLRYTLTTYRVQYFESSWFAMDSGASNAYWHAAVCRDGNGTAGSSGWWAWLVIGPG